MTGARRFSVSSPDWGQDHLSWTPSSPTSTTSSPRSHTRGPGSTCAVLRRVRAPRSSPRARLARPCAPPVAQPAVRRCCPACVPSRRTPSCPAVPPGLGDDRRRSARLAARRPDTGRADASARRHARRAPGTVHRPTQPRRSAVRRGSAGAAADLRPGAVSVAVSGLALGALAFGALATPAGRRPAPAPADRSRRARVRSGAEPPARSTVPSTRGCGWARPARAPAAPDVRPLIAAATRTSTAAAAPPGGRPIPAALRTRQAR